MHYLINNLISGHPFVANKIWIKKGIFQSGYSNCYVDCALHKAAYGNSVKNNSKKAIAAAIGEHLERLALFNPLIKNNQGIKYYVEAFNLVTGETINIPLEDVILEYGLPIFNDRDMSNAFSDTCGVASHTSSDFALEAAFLEFIERQSLIHTWLTKKAGKLIPLNLLNNIDLKKIINMSRTYKGIQEFYLVDISITDEIKVVLALGFGKESFSIGAGAHWNIMNAIERAMNEYFQFMTGFWGNNDESESSDGDLYYEYCNTLSPEAFKQEYKFVIDTKTQYNPYQFHKNTSQERINLSNKIRKVVEDLDISVYATFIPERMDFNTKIVKVFSSDCYPHMNTALLNPMDYKFSSKFNQSIFKNLYRLIPFP
ncbi:MULTISPECIES: YcaO-like family protein [Brevibacillus]|jgi:ribosomal protein S12 methylthiotransferase accessory factor YcaO|uniref:YcaO-like family protein n=1 Tax=Brevibacillus TaxID=55080 RepID=UPI00046A4CCC|nr:YcaO-like family protein [Brevibacillus borstelensis]MBE5394768.1 YcaO-like family protein [Brevibacillus borstelensis]MCM3472236.1 YcaO-like family protein [Brevibacillus borstelensis]MCM3560220.1 YcaO-like family protein [Brevibacillus borstelensis]MCM3590234.1 YcaO-like family protein [Brevibacillus borstelensis]MCM3623631.1 YcaO-like family protein [Brevibacillus borstelensis]